MSSEELIRKHADMIYRIALLHVKNSHNADDIFQEVCIRLIKNIDKLKDPEHAKAWLIRVTINCCKSHLTSFWHTHMVSYDDTFGENGEEAEETVMEPSETYEAVKQLPQKYRDVIHLFYYEGMTVKEIADVLEIKENAVKVRMLRARNMLRDSLREA